MTQLSNLGPLHCRWILYHLSHQRILLKLMSIELVILSNHFILCFSLLLQPSIFTTIRVFSNKSTLPIKWPKYWCFSFSISPSSEYSALISFIINWFDLPAVQGTLKSLPQHHNLKASILQCSAFFMVQVSQNLSAMQETPVQLLGEEDPLEMG